MADKVGYTRFSRRIRALMVDGLFLSIAFFIVMLSVTALKLESSLLESFLIFFIVVSIEPVFITFTGSSLGHHLVGLRVRRVSRDTRLNLFMSYLRFLTKIPLGSLSLVTVLTSRRHQALHDIFSRSLVVHKSPEKLPSFEVLEERFSTADNYTYPSKLRRIAMIFLYILILFISVPLLNFTLLSESCLIDNICQKQDSIIRFALSIGAWGGFFVVIWAGWNGRLPGGRRSITLETGVVS